MYETMFNYKEVVPDKMFGSTFVEGLAEAFGKDGKN
jgi:hypothetical protein